MNTTEQMLPAIWNSISQHVAILDESGKILDVNPAWEAYAKNNGGFSEHTGKGSNYLDTCDVSSHLGNADAPIVAAGIRNLFNTDGIQEFSLEYPCHGPNEQSWYKVKAWRLDLEAEKYAVITHKEVTQTVLQRQALQADALTDSLTGIANRRHFDRFLAQEWRRDMRRGTPITLIMIDIDYFKLLNDNYGHLTGDKCLKRIAQFISSMAQRPGDIAARIGGEEFALVMGATQEKAAKQFAEFIRAGIEQLQIPNEDSTVSKMITASVGASTRVPGRASNKTELVAMADEALYLAKNKGRNTVVIKNS